MNLAWIAIGQGGPVENADLVSCPPRAGFVQQNGTVLNACGPRVDVARDEEWID